MALSFLPGFSHLWPMHSPFLFLRSIPIVIHNSHLHHRAYDVKERSYHLNALEEEWMLDWPTDSEKTERIKSTQWEYSQDIHFKAELAFPGDSTSWYGPGLVPSSWTSHSSLIALLHCFCQEQIPRYILYQGLVVARPGRVWGGDFQYSPCPPFWSLLFHAQLCSSLLGEAPSPHQLPSLKTQPLGKDPWSP